VERALETNFTLASRWRCILLLDEADVFLAARTPTDFIRNGLVSGQLLSESAFFVSAINWLLVFLRVLEYYAGILFLTTNRVGDFDEAFASRIHISLHYPPLDLISTQKIFTLNLNRIKTRFAEKKRILNINEIEIGGFATTYWRNNPKARWNGRQIRNACQTALALAEFEAQGSDHGAVLDADAAVNLEVKHFQKVADANLDFMGYLKDIYGVHGDERAAENFLRAGNNKTNTAKPPNALATRKTECPTPKEQAEYSGHQQADHNTYASQYQHYPMGNPHGSHVPPYYQHSYHMYPPGDPGHGYPPNQFAKPTAPQQTQTWANSESGSYTCGKPAMMSNLQYNNTPPSMVATEANNPAVSATTLIPTAQG
jgi:hypothetical protein